MQLISKFINTSLITNTKLQLSHQPNFQLYNNKVLATTRIGHGAQAKFEQCIAMHYYITGISFVRVEEEHLAMAM